MRWQESTLCDAAGLERLISGLADQVLADHRPDLPLAFVGIRTRGVPIASRLAERVRQESGIEVPVGAVDITLYRDDVGRGTRWPVLLGTEIPFAVEGAKVVLIDDVLYTGRTVRAALNSVCDLGRPAAVRLAVVVDRGGREFPIEANYVGLRCEAATDQRVVVRIRPVDPHDSIDRISPST